MVVQHSSKDYFHQVRAETSLRYIYSDDINFKAGNDITFVRFYVLKFLLLYLNNWHGHKKQNLENLVLTPKAWSVFCTFSRSCKHKLLKLDIFVGLMTKAYQIVILEQNRIGYVSVCVFYFSWLYQLLR